MPLRSQRPGSGGGLSALAAAGFLLALAAPPVAPPAGASDQGRNIAFTRLTQKEGLSQDIVFTITQDREGYMWFGTQEGLNRYDGVEIHTYTRRAGESGSLISDSVRALLVDGEGSLWVGTDGGGLHLYDSRTDGFVNYRHDPSDPTSLGHDRVRALVEDSEGVLWVGTHGGGLARFDRESRVFTGFVHDPERPDSLPDDKVSSLLLDEAGRLWVGTDGGGLCLFERAAGTCRTYRHRPGDRDSLSADRIRSLYQDREGRIWIGTYEKGLNQLDAETGSFARFRHDPEDPRSLGADRVRDVFQDLSGTLWVATDGGLDEWVPAERGFRHHRHEIGNPNSLGDDRVITIFQDRGGVVWVGTYAGLCRWNALTGSFARYRQDTETGFGLSASTVTAFHEDPNGSIWVGTYGGGLNLFDRVTGRFSQIRSRRGDRTSLSDDRVMSLLVTRDGTLWVGTLAGGLNRFDRRRPAFTRFVHDADDPTSLSADGVTTMVEDRTGTLWVGTYQAGLNRLDADAGAFTRYRHDPDNPAGLPSDQVVALAEDGAGMLWIGTDGGGVSRLDPISGKLTHFRHDSADAESLSSDAVWSIHEDRMGNLWLGTRGAGLNQWRSEDRAAHRARFRRYGKEDGLLSTAIYGILSDSEGHVWVSSNRGLSRLDPQREVFRHYDTSHGLQGNEFNAGASFQARDGQMFLGGPKGFNAFYPSQIRDNAYVPPIVINGFLKFNRELNLQAELSRAGAIDLTHKDSVIAFDFAALDYTAPEKNRYRYRLEGFEDDWIDAGPMRRAVYTNLGAGSYTFRVQGSNNDGRWNTEGAALGLVVAPPPWRSLWAYTLYVAAVGLLVLGLVRIQARERERSMALEKVNRSLEQEVAERERARAELQKLSMAVEQSPASVMITDPRGHIEYVNPKFQEVTGYALDEVLGRRPDFLGSGYQAAERYENLWRTVSGGEEWRGELHSKKKNGKLFWEYVSLSPIKEDDGSVTHILAINEDITTRKDYEERLMHQANFDLLTQLPNRVLVLDRMGRALVQDRDQSHTVAVLLVDLDNFKIVNDTLGHTTGDELLKAAARRLSSLLRASDTVARMGGDEFLVLLPDLGEALDAELIAGKILDAFSQPFDLDGRDIFMTASIGITVAPADGNDPHVLMRNADAAMYRAKERGRSSYEFFTPAMNERAMRRLSLESNLRRALEEGELEVRFQPVVSADDGAVHSAEALLRWDSPELGQVPPEQFVPVAEETGLISPIGEWVLQEACRRASDWADQTGVPLRVAVNVSARQFKADDLERAVSRALDESGLAPGCLELEITERLLMRDDQETTRSLHQLHDMGVRLAVDDFGTGYSALSYLKRYPFDILKIDRTFVGNLLQKHEDRAVVTAIVAMGKSLGLEVIAEGVETEEQLAALREHGCRLVQGFLFSRAVDGDEIPQICRRGFAAAMKGVERRTLRAVDGGRPAG